MAVLENNCGAAAPGTVEVQAITTDVDQLARGMELRSIFLACTTFIAQPDQCDDHERCDFNRKHHAKSTRAIPCELLILAQASKEEAGGENTGHSDA